ncbi:MAG: glycosyltransferase family 4 protein [Propionibacteriaceae bacterium]|jgi:glycosyltransferase involved in cell wall biosynthesis|nr:glycosyltransferase family 4 protein [Propionibacteriaceae bacterium]
MRIAYVCADPGIPVLGSKGASIHVRAIVKELMGLGHEVTLVAARSGDDTTIAAPILSLADQITEDFHGEDAKTARARALDAAVAPLLDEIAPDLVYERYSLWGRTATAWARRHSVPSILEVNAPLPLEAAQHRGLTDVEGATALATQAIAAATSVICVSDPVAQWARSLLPENGSGHVHVLANGVDPTRIHPSPGSSTTSLPGDGFSPDPSLDAAGGISPCSETSEADVPAAAETGAVFTVGFVGTLRPWHGVEILVDAMGELVATDPTWRLLVVGGGPIQPELQAQAADVCLADKAEWTGAVPEPGVLAHLHRMDVAVAPYPPVENSYFSPLKLYEYLAAGLPVVASAVGQIPQALDGGRLGVLVEAGDPHALAEALRQLRADPARREQLSRDGRAEILARHTWRHVAERTLAACAEDAAARRMAA